MSKLYKTGLEIKYFPVRERDNRRETRYVFYCVKMRHSGIITYSSEFTVNMNYTSISGGINNYSAYLGNIKQVVF